MSRVWPCPTQAATSLPASSLTLALAFVLSLALHEHHSRILSTPRPLNEFIGIMSQADIVIWDFKTREVLHRLIVHKEKVQALAFSPNDQFLASLGGREDNIVLVWDVASGKAGLPCVGNELVSLLRDWNFSCFLLLLLYGSCSVWIIDGSETREWLHRGAHICQHIRPHVHDGGRANLAHLADPSQNPQGLFSDSSLLHQVLVWLHMLTMYIAAGGGRSGHWGCTT